MVNDKTKENHHYSAKRSTSCCVFSSSTFWGFMGVIIGGVISYLSSSLLLDKQIQFESKKTIAAKYPKLLSALRNDVSIFHDNSIKLAVGIYFKEKNTNDLESEFKSSFNDFKLHIDSLYWFVRGYTQKSVSYNTRDIVNDITTSLLLDKVSQKNSDIRRETASKLKEIQKSVDDFIEQTNKAILEKLDSTK